MQKYICNCLLPPVNKRWYTCREDIVRELENRQPAVKMLEAGGKRWEMGTFILLVLISKATMSDYVMTMSRLAALLGVIAKLSCVQNCLLKAWLG